MSDLTKKEKINLRPQGGLASRLRAAELAKEIPGIGIAAELGDPIKKENRIAMLLDCSGSMSGEPIKLLQAAAQDFVSKANFTTTSIALESFPAGTRTNLTSDKAQLWMLCIGLDSGGDTPMCSAMSYVLESVPATRAILISDGQPTDDRSYYNDEPASGSLAFQRAFEYKAKGIIVDTVHVGTSEQGEDVLQRIAEITGGIYVKFRDIQKFAEAFRFLLPETRANAFGLLKAAGADEVK